MKTINDKIDENINTKFFSYNFNKDIIKNGSMNI